MRFMNLADKYSKDNSKFIILPIEYEKDVSSGKGAEHGSKEIIKASSELEYYDEQFQNEPFIKGIRTHKPLSISSLKPDEAIEKIRYSFLKEKNKFTISLGGDHAVTIGIVKGLEEVHDDFSIIILDAHSDFFHSWNGSEYNHRCVSQRVSERHEILIVGVRSMDADEEKIIKKNKNAYLIKAYDFDIKKILEILKKLNKKVYISIDVDVFDPSFIRNTGTPEPGGFQWNDVINILKIIFENKEVIGADIVEFAPKENFIAEAYSLAKLSYKIMSLKVNQL